MQTMERPTIAPVRPRRRPVPWPLAFYRSAIGKKWVMAVTGILLMGYVFAHMLGNLHVYGGAQEMNEYGEFLRELLVPLVPRTWTLWALRVGLIVAFALHIHAAYALTVMNRRARAAGRYVAPRDWQAANAASRSMRLTGIVIALFVLWHLADLTWGTVNPDFVRGDVFRNLVASFRRPVNAGFYIVANLALGLHLFHGSWSLFQSLGINNPRWNHWRRGFAAGFAGIVVIGNLSFPIAVLTGLVSADDNSDCRIVGGTIETCELYEGHVDSANATDDVMLGEGSREPIVLSLNTGGSGR